MSKVVGLHRPGLRYVAGAPFDPPNEVYLAVEDLFAAMGLDGGRRGTPEWNPLGDLVPRGGRVVVKPNLVSQKNLHARIEGERLAASSTHGSLLRPLLDYAVRAVGPSGRVRVLDAPVEGCVVEDVAGPLGVFDVIRHLAERGAPIDFVDLRTFRMRPAFVLDDVRSAGRSFNAGALVRTSLPGDPEGYRTVDLGGASLFARGDAPPGSRLRFHRSHYTTPVPHHTGGRNEYSLPGSVLGADLILHVPKMKTHKKTGVTLGLKSVIGLTNQKYWLPHFTEGDPSVGGDEFDRPQSMRERAAHLMSRAPLPGGHSLVLRAPRLDAPPSVIDGSWEGNRTLFRTIVDLNLAIEYARRDGTLATTPQRTLLTIVDGIVAGEGEGPMGSTPISAGMLVAGREAARVDEACARWMGLDPSKIPMIVEAVYRLAPAPDGVVTELVGPPVSFRFKPPKSWPSLRS